MGLRPLLPRPAPGLVLAVGEVATRTNRHTVHSSGSHATLILAEGDIAPGDSACMTMRWFAAAEGILA
jgi:hypothetical protein